MQMKYTDIWWLVWGIFLVAIIERKKIDDPDKPWFDLFRICFELVSAFGGIGLSLGTPRVRYGLLIHPNQSLECSLDSNI